MSQLSEQQKQALLKVYLQAEMYRPIEDASYLDKEKLEKSHLRFEEFDPVRYLSYIKSQLSDAHINLYLTNDNWSSQNAQVCAYIKNKLLAEILRHISPTELYQHLYNVHDHLKTNDAVSKIAITSAYAKLTKSYYQHERKEAEKKAASDTRWFCYFIVTIPFYSLYYNYRLRKHSENFHFQKSEFQLPSNSSELIKAGLGKKHIDKSSKEMSFSNNHAIRKIRTIGSSSANPGMWTVTLIGTKDQIQRHSQKRMV